MKFIYFCIILSQSFVRLEIRWSNAIRTEFAGYRTDKSAVTLSHDILN